MTLLLLMQWPFKKYICAQIRLYDGSAVLKNSDRQTDKQTVQTILNSWLENKFTLLCVVSSILRNGLQINTLISRCKQTWAGAIGARGGGRVLRPVTSSGFLGNGVGAHVMGALMVIAAWGEGVNVCLVPPPPRRIACHPTQSACKNSGWGLDT